MGRLRDHRVSEDLNFLPDHDIKLTQRLRYLMRLRYYSGFVSSFLLSYSF